MRSAIWAIALDPTEFHYLMVEPGMRRDQRLIGRAGGVQLNAW
jgi:hypothetical protein